MLRPAADQMIAPNGPQPPDPAEFTAPAGPDADDTHNLAPQRRWRPSFRPLRLSALDATTPGLARPRLLFATVLVLYPAYELLLAGRMILQGQMWAELGSYFGVTRDLPLLTELRATDAGYIPLPQRLIAAAGSLMRLPAEAIPYYYNAAALLGAALLVGALCLPAFRGLIRNDYLRFAIALAILLIPDFNTKAFTNFTYFAAVFAVGVAALGALRPGPPLPRWVWWTPLLVLSKPAVLLTVPLLVAAASISRGRRMLLVCGVSLVAAAIQVYSVITNPTVIVTDHEQSFAHKLLLTGRHAVGFLGRYTTSVLDPVSATAAQLVGTVVLLVAVAVVLMMSATSEK